MYFRPEIFSDDEDDLEIERSGIYVVSLIDRFEHHFGPGGNRRKN